jgi:hypothetical protein
MSQQPQSQVNNGDHVCPRCGTKNPAMQERCTSCGAILKGQATAANREPSAAADIANIVVGAFTLGAAAYGLWKATRKPAPEPPPTAQKGSIPVEQARTSAPRKAATQQPAPPPAAAQPVQQPARPRPAPGEQIEGWVTGVITTRGLPQRLIKEAEEQVVEISATPSFYVGYVPIYSPPKTRHVPAVYAPPTAQFVFALVEYPSGPVSQWGESLYWTDVDILWSSEEFLDRRTSLNEEPAETPELRAMVGRLVQTAKNDGWEPLALGQTWCNYRLRKRYAQVGVPLKWK